MLGGGRNGRFGLDDGVVITSNHVVIAGGLSTAVKNAKEKLGYLHKIGVQVSNETELREAITSGADAVLFRNLSPEEVAPLTAVAQQLSPMLSVECSGNITLDNVRAYTEAGANLIRISALTDSLRALDVTFQVQPV